MMDPNTLAFGLLIAAIVVAVLLARRQRRRAEAARREHRPHSPGDGRDRGAMARSAMEGHAGSR